MKTWKDIAKTVYYRSRGALRHWGEKTQPDAAAARERDVLAQLKSDGYARIDGYYDAETCRALRDELDRVIRDYANVLWRDEHDSDVRAFAIETVSPLAAKFHDDPFLNRIAKLYLGETQTCFFTLANRVTPAPGNLGSGGGWHRDTPHERQFKSLLYLSDVGPENGAFEYLPQSHHVGYFVDTIYHDGVKYGQHRFVDDEIAGIAARTGAAPIRFAAPAGTLLLVDSSGIHRGSPISSGTRHALTNYFFDAETVERLKATGKFTGYFVNRTPS